jgi:light-regulated signal transduction histidine kinase (bacteriophytochrome)
MQRRAESLAKVMTEDARGARNELEAKLIELEQSNNDLQKFAYVASHNLKSPMRAVHQLAVWIEEELEGVNGLEETEVHKYLNQLNGRADRMQKLLDSLITYATVGENRLELTSFESGTCIREVIEFISLPSEVKISLNGDMPRIYGERALFE